MASQASWYLTVQKGPNSGRVYPLAEGSMTIGRHANNTITIDDARISRHHVRLTRRGNTMHVEDMGSANGTFVNNIRVNSPVQLREGDLIGLSQDIILRFERQPSADDATVLVPSRPVVMAAASPLPVAAAPAKGGSNWLTIAITGVMGLIIVVLLVIAAGLFLFRNNSAAVSQTDETPTPSPTSTPSPTVAPTYTPYPTYTPVPTEAATATPYPTYTPVPTEVPTATPYPTYTPVPTEVPTATPYPTYTPVPAKIVVVEATQPLPTAAPITLPTATPAEPPFVLSLGRNVGYEPWGKPGDPDGCGPPYDDRIEVRRFTAEVILTNNSKQFIGEDWWPTMLSASGAPVPSCWFYYNNVVVEPGETTDVTYTSYLPKGDYVKAMVFPILGQTAVICMGPNGQEVPCP